ncbi:hypothetical protein F1847_08850 [Thermodesulfobacterium sp. TA1]|uniref:hypothetical protein n=1 Tax=Thermodesulfobacterium sp. TA1 TaxID=2234087 RepID=UPI001232614A|nr:hypothetical protein [Thermodesulfobacterium sp. TA1]QER42843.1 hypothetical protein F1847_08850 [Thermodesulfobacterium sp. TA1]
MNQEFFVNLVKKSVKAWGIEMFDKVPVLTEFFNYQKTGGLKDFSYKEWYENDFLGMVLVITAEKNLVVNYAKKVYPHFMIDFNLLKDLEPFCLKTLQELTQRLTQKVLEELNQTSLRFQLKKQECFKSVNSIQPLWGMLNLSFNYRIAPIGDLGIYFISGPKEYLSKRYLSQNSFNSFSSKKNYLAA